MQDPGKRAEENPQDGGERSFSVTGMHQASRAVSLD